MQCSGEMLTDPLERVFLQAKAGQAPHVMALINSEAPIPVPRFNFPVLRQKFRVRKKGSFGKGVFSKRGLFEKGSFQKSPLSRDSPEFRVFGESREYAQTVENKGESDHFPEILENLEILEILEISPVKRNLSRDP